VRTVVYDEELMFSEGVATLFGRRGHEIVGLPHGPDQLLHLVRTQDVEACLVSVGPAPDGDVDLIRQLRELRATLAIVALSTAADLGALLNVLGGGADGFCLKTDGIDEIDGLLHRCAEGRRVPVSHDPKVTLSSSATAACRRRASKRSLSLTPKEQRVLDLLVEGASTSEIARQLGVGEATVRTHLQHLFSKFGVHSRLALVAQAVRTNAVNMGRGTHTLPNVS
jgi:DNA-binding NarL/FixJ family response regulator